MANAAAYATLALGLNIVVGFAGLLDLGYAAFFAIGAYTYGILTAFQVQPEWSSFWEPFQYLGLVAKMPGETGDASVVHFTLSFWLALPLAAALGGVLWRAVRRADAAAAWRLSGHRHAGLRRDRADRRAQLGQPDQWRRRTERRGRRRGCSGWSFGVDATPYYYVAIALVALLVFISIRLRDSRIGRAWMAIREDEIAAGAMGVNRHQVQAAGLCDRRRVRRHDRRVLCRQVADRDAGNVRLPGLGDDPGDDRVRRHRQRVGRGAGRFHPATAAILVAAGPDGMAARARPAGRQSAGSSVSIWCRRSS